MEKINTPLMAQIEIEKKRLDEASIAYHRADSNKDGLGMQLAKNKMIESAHCLSVLKSLIPSERLYMERAHEKGCIDSMPDGYVITLPDSRNIKQCFEEYFTQTFKSYE